MSQRMTPMLAVSGRRLGSLEGSAFVLKFDGWRVFASTRRTSRIG